MESKLCTEAISRLSRCRPYSWRMPDNGITVSRRASRPRRRRWRGFPRGNRWRTRRRGSSSRPRSLVPRSLARSLSACQTKAMTSLWIFISLALAAARASPSPAGFTFTSLFFTVLCDGRNRAAKRCEIQIFRLPLDCPSRIASRLNGRDRLIHGVLPIHATWQANYASIRFKFGTRGLCYVFIYVVAQIMLWRRRASTAACSSNGCRTSPRRPAGKRFSPVSLRTHKTTR